MNQPKIKLLIVEPVSDLGGVSQYIITLVRHLSSSTYEIHFSSSGSDGITNILKTYGVTIHRLHIDYRWWTFLFALMQFRLFLKREQFHIMHLHTARAGFLGVCAKTGLPVRTVYTGHGWRFIQKDSRFLRQCFLRFELYIVKHVDRITFHSEYEERIAVNKHFFCMEKAVCIPTHLDLQKFSFPLSDQHIIQSKYHIPPPIIVGMMGRITFQKYPEFFFNVAAIVGARNPTVKFMWIGEGELRNRLEKLVAREGLSDRFLITGYVPGQDVPKLLSLLDIFFFVSRFEGLPRCLLEAMAMKRIIVAPRISNIPDLIKDGATGYLYSPGDVLSAANVLQRILDDPHSPKVEEIKLNAYRLIERDYAPEDKVARALSELYQGLVSS
jgi:glycosyltransferase involved in cell wall biosynthesis